MQIDPYKQTNLKTELRSEFQVAKRQDVARLGDSWSHPSSIRPQPIIEFEPKPCRGSRTMDRIEIEEQQAGIPTLDCTHQTLQASLHGGSEIEVTFPLFAPELLCYQFRVSTCSFFAVSGDPGTN